MWTSILQWLEGVIYKMLNSNNTQITTALSQQVGSLYNISAEMQAALQTWNALYLNRGDHLITGVKSMNLAKAISSEIASTATIEMGVEVSGSTRADYLQLQMNKILENIRQQIEFGNAKGGLMFKPYVDAGSICWDYVQADMFYPLAFDANQNITSCVFADRKKRGAYWYTLFESHQLMTDGTYIIRNVAYRSDSQNYLGAQVDLSYIPEWADIQPETILQDITQPLYGYFRVPAANGVDPTSPLSVSCFASAVEQIKEADKQYSRFLWEFESGERALYVDKSALQTNSDGTPKLPDRRLFRVLNVAPASITEPGFFKEWSPEFRDSSLINGLNNILRLIEFNCGLSYGVLSNETLQAFTATEIRASKQRYYVTITDTQKKIKNALNAALYAADVWATIYSLAPRGDYQAVYSFDDSIVADHATAFNQDKEVVDGGGMGWVEFRMRNYGETEEVATEKVRKAQEEKRTANAPAVVIQ